MKAGHVVTIRINPRDCQSVLDVLDAAGVPRKALSFAQCVSLSLGSLLETARRNNLIPEPDEFEYLNRMSEYMTPDRRRKSARVADALHNLGGRLRSPALGGAEEGPSAAQVRAGDHRDASEADDPAELAEAQKQLTQLLIKKEQAEDGGPWSDEDERRFQHFYSVVYPDG